MTHYLQVLLVERRGDDVRRLHLRFAAGDDSYNYFVGGSVHMGQFRDADAIGEAKAMLRRHLERLSAVLTRSTLAEAGLRTEDSASFMANLLKTGRVETDVGSAAPYFLSVAIAEPGGEVLRGRFETDASDELLDEVADLLSDCMSVADSLG